MNSLINYLFEANLCLLLLGGIYYLFLRKETDFRFRRRFIIASALIALITPLLKLGDLGTGSIGLSEISTTILPELVVGQTEADTSIFDKNLLPYLKWAYIIVGMIILQYLVFQLLQVLWFYVSNKHKSKYQNNVTLINTNGTLPTFSFFNILFFDNSIDLTSSEKEKILRHELAHIEQYHSLDILLIESLKILIWFNPLSWYFKKEIQELHEYLADDKVTDQQEIKFYNSLLAKMALNQAHLSIGHHFNKSQTLKRIKMIQTMKTKVTSWKATSLAALLLFTAVMVSCNDEVIQDIDTVMETASQTEIPSELMGNFERLKEKYPDADFAYLETDGTSAAALDNLKELDINTIALVHVFEEKSKIGVFINKNGPLSDIANTPDENEIFTVVDETSAPVDGFEAYYQKMSSVLKYPIQAKELGVEGRVYVQFIVDEIGELHDLKVVKGIGAGCDQAALDAVAQAGKWTPPMQNGKAVKQRMVLPITFALSSGEASEKTEGK